MEGMIDRFIKLLDDDDASAFRIRSSEIKKCHGIVFLEAVQVGFLFSAQMGTGILVRHDKEKNAWGPPMAIGITGVGAGLMMGAEKKDMIIVLPEEQMTKAMSSNFSFRIGLDHSWAIGIGQGDVDKNVTAQIGNEGGAVTSAHQATAGLYMGTSAETSALAPRTAVNEKFYGQKMEPKDIVFGDLKTIKPQCEPVERLHAKLLALKQAS